MDNDKISELISDYLLAQFDTFTIKDFQTYLHRRGAKLTKMELADFLYSSDYVFPLVNQEFITRAGVFTGRWFSFCPSKEEVRKNHIILGHRCMPFVNQEISPDSYILVSDADSTEPEPQTFSMNLALDTYAMFGEGYVIPCILSDKANNSVPLASVQYSLPAFVELTSWPLDKLFPGQNFEFGDRILCQVIDWSKNIIKVALQKNDRSGFVVSASAIKREEWYSQVEDALLSEFERHGPASSIEAQLSYLFLENRDMLCTKYCGSIEEFIVSSKKVRFQPYGLESRLWRADSEIPCAGSWSNQQIDTPTLSDMKMMLTPSILDAFIENQLYKQAFGKSSLSPDDLLDSIFPNMLSAGSFERSFLLLNLKKRFDILKSTYNAFRDYPVAEIRSRCVELFSNIFRIVCGIGEPDSSADDFPQQEFVILSQLYIHLVRLLDEVENDCARDDFPADDVSLSLEGMEETFYGIRDVLEKAVEDNQVRGYGIVTESNNLGGADGK